MQNDRPHTRDPIRGGCQFSKEIALKADLILVMELAHKTVIEKIEVSARGKVFRLGEWGNFDIPDPYQKNFEEFESVFELIQLGVTQWLEKFK